MVTLFTPFLLCAQEDTLDLTPVEVRAVRAGATAPFAKTNLGRADIARQNLGADLPFLLQQTPSVVAYSDAGNGVGYTGLRIRGTDPTRINVTLNGIPFNDAESGGTFFVDLPDFASSVHSIQVQRGVGTSSNGAGAFGATINISTNESATTPYLAFNNSYGSFSTLKNTLQAGSGTWGRYFSTDIRLSRISSSGYIDRASSHLRSFYVSQAFQKAGTSLRLNIFSGKEKTYQAWYGVSQADLQSNRTVNYAGTEKPDAPYENETDNYTQTHYQLFFNQKLPGTWVLNTGLFYVRGKGFYEQYKADEDYSDYGLAYPVQNGDTVYTTDLVRQLWLDNHFYGSVFSLQRQHATTQLTFGGAAMEYLGDHYGLVNWAKNGFTPTNRWYDNDGRKKDLNLYGKWQQQLGSGLQLFTDLQWRYVEYRVEGFRYNPSLMVNRQYHFFNPKLGLSYLKDGLQIFGSYSVAHREPSRDDFETGSLEGPKPERLYDAELGLEQKGTGHSFGANLYFMQYKNQLVLTGKLNDVGAYTKTNIDNSYRLGIELQGAFAAASWMQLSGNLTLSRNRIRNFTEYIDDYDAGGQKSATYPETDISFSPSVTGSATILWKPLKNVQVYQISKYVGKQYLDNTSNESRMLDPYFVQDLQVVYSLQPKNFKNIELTAMINNLFDTKYEPNGYTFSYYYNNQLQTENYYFPMAGINWMVGLNVKL